MGLHHSPRIATDGLVLCLDAADKNSYTGSGNTVNIEQFTVITIK